VRAKRILTVGPGWFIVPVERGKPFKAIWHDGGTGGFRSVAGFVKETSTAVVVLSNSSRPVDGIGLKIVRELV
jgi:serine-type D-Ala-D-Ala carboxypeptidase/endopeptidase